MRSKYYKTTASQSLGVLQGKVALAALKGDQTLADLAQQFDVHVNQIAQWRSQLLEGAAGVFGDEPTPNPSEKADLSRLRADGNVHQRALADQKPE